MADEVPGSPAGITLNLDPYPRVLGVILLALGLILGFVAFYFPIHDALQGAAKVTLYSKAIFGSVAFIIMGLILIVLGPIAARVGLRIAVLKGWKKWLVYAVLLIPLIICGEMVERIFKQYLAGFGYTF